MTKRDPVAIGIDLGTTYSAIAHLDAEGRPWTIRNAEGDVTTPSVVFFDHSSIIVGKEAAKLAPLEPDRLAVCAKRDIGSAVFSKLICGRELPPEVIAACILRKLKRDAELVVGGIEKVVITVPAYFDEPRRKATQDAGRIGGLEVLDIINEPTAAAIAFGVQRGFLSNEGTEQSERLLVYDLGGGTFDVTLMEIEGKDFRTIATGGDVYLGGMDWDRRIVDHLAEEFQRQCGDIDLREQHENLARLLREAEEAKRTLSARDEATIVVEHESDRLRLRLTRQKFEDLTRDLVERTRFTTTRVMREAGVKWSDLTRLLVVGGSTRMPMIQQMLEREFGRPVDRSLSADEAVAQGAAVYAGLLLSGRSAIQTPRAINSVTNVNSHNLAVLGVDRQTGRPRSRVMIPRNTALPASTRGQFVTQLSGQRTVCISIVEGGDQSGNNATMIGKCIISDLPPGLPPQTPVDVVFTYSQDGRLTVQAYLKTIGASATLTIQRPAGVSEYALKDWEVKLESGQLFDETPANEEVTEAKADGPFTFIAGDSSIAKRKATRKGKRQRDVDSDAGDFFDSLSSS